MGEAGAGHIFLSHNAQDKPQVEALARLLLDRGLRPWLDKWEIAAGRSWQEALQLALEQAAAVLVCVGAHDLGRVQLPEIEAALALALRDSARLVIPVFLPGARSPELLPSLKSHVAIDLRAGEGAYAQLFAALGSRAQVSAPAPAEHSPFRGLEVFEERHARWYFGREADLARLLVALRERRLLVLIGASGSGKSSLVRAGLLPAVRTGELDPRQTWVPLLLRPGARPLHELALRVASACSVPREVAALREGMRIDPGLLADELDLEAVRHEGERRFLIVVDQFEEVFTLCEDPAARAAFIAALLAAARVPGGRTHLVWTLRADFVAALLQQPGFAEQPLDTRSHLLLGPLGESQLRAAIRRPALLAGLELEPGLEELLVQSAAGEAADLPLLQFALEELWTRREGRRLTLAAYRAMGGVKGALARRADAELERLGPQQRPLVRRLLGRLVQLGEGTGDVRRRLAAGELALTHPELGAPLEALVRSRLLTAHEQEVEIAHEALIREWGTLRGWLASDRELLRVQHELARCAVLWRRSGEASDLWRGGRLARALELCAGDALTLAAGEREFLDASAAEADASARAERERRERALGAARALAAAQASAARRLRFGLASAAALLAACGAVAHAAREAQRAAEGARRGAERTIEEAIGVADLMVFTVAEELKEVPGAAGVRRAILESGAALLQRLSRAVDAGNRAALQRSRAAFHAQRGDLALRIDDVALARAEYGAALGIRAALAEQQPADADALLDWALSHEKLAAVASAEGRLTEARAEYRESLQIRERLAAAQPADLRVERSFLGSYRGLADVAASMGAREESAALYRRAFELAERLASATPADLELAAALALGHRDMAGIALEAEDQADARRQLERALAIEQSLARKQPGDTERQDALAAVQRSLGTLQDGWNPAAARASMEGALAIARNLVEREPLDLGLQLRLANTLSSLAGLTEVSTREAQELYREAQGLLEGLAQRDPGNASVQLQLAQGFRTLASNLESVGKYAEARAPRDRAIQIARSILGRDPANVRAELELARGYLSLGGLLRSQGRYAEARTAMDSALQIDRALLARGLRDRTMLAADLITVANLATSEAKNADARRSLEDAVRVLDAPEPTPAAERTRHFWLAHAHAKLAALDKDAEQYEAALGGYTRAQELLERSDWDEQERPQVAMVRFDIRLGIAESLRALERSSEAKQAYEESLLELRRQLERRPKDPILALMETLVLQSLLDLAHTDGTAREERARYEELRRAVEARAALRPERLDFVLLLVDAEGDLGKRALAGRRFSQAHEYLERARARALELAPRQDLDTDPARRLVFQTARWLADLAQAEGQPGQARAGYAGALEFALEQAKAEPDDTEWQRAVGIAQLGLGVAAASQGQLAAAREHLARALEIAQANAQRRPQDERLQGDLRNARERLAALPPEAPGDAPR